MNGMELKVAINHIRAAVKICGTIKNFDANEGVCPYYECSDHKGRMEYSMQVIQYNTTEPPNVNQTVGKDEKNVIIAEKFRNTDNLIVFQATIKDISKLPGCGTCCLEYSGLSAYLIYHRLKREYIKQQRGQQK